MPDPSAALLLALLPQLHAHTAPDDPDGEPPAPYQVTLPSGTTVTIGQDGAHARELSNLLLPEGGSSTCSGLGPVERSTADAPEGDTPTWAEYTPDGARYLIAHRDSENVLVFDAATGAFQAEIPVSGSPQGLAIRPDGLLAVTANFGTDTASVIDLVSLSEVAVVPVGTLPAGVRCTPDGTRAVVANYGSSDLSVIDLTSFTETARFGPVNYHSTVSFAPEPAAATFALGDFEVVDDQTVLVPDLFNAQLAFCDVSTSTVVTVPCDASPRGLSVASGAGLAVVSHTSSTQRVSVVDIATRSIVQTFPTGVDLWGPIAVDPVAARAVAAIQNACVVVDLSTGAVSPSLNTASVNRLLSTADGLYALCVGFNGSLISFAGQNLVTNLNSVVSTAIGAVSPTAPQAVLLATTFGEDAVRVNTAGAAGFLESIVPSGVPPEADKSRRVAVHGPSGRAVVTNILSDTASVVDLASGVVLAVLDVGNRPSDVEITPDGTRAVVANLDSTFASVLDLVALTSTQVPISTRGAEVEISPDGQFAYVSVVSGGDGVWRIDLSGLASSGPKLPVGEMGGVGYAYSQSSGLTLSDDGAWLVACNSFDDTVTVIDAVAWSVLGTVGVGDFPTRATFRPGNNLVYVSNRDGDDVSEVRIQPALAELKRIPAGDVPYESVFTPTTGQLAVLSTGSTAPAVEVVDVIASTSVTTIPLPNAPSGIALSGDGSRLLVSSGTWSVTFGAVFEIGQEGALTAIDTATLGVLGETDLGVPPADLDLDSARFAAPSPFGPGLMTGPFPAGLSVDASALSLGAGGTIGFCLSLGAAQAGDLYLLLGSATGTTPPLTVDGLELPLVVDAYFFQTLLRAGLPPYVGTFGLLDGLGQATANLVVPAGSVPQLAGVTLFHAAVAADPVFGTAQVASNPTSLRLEP